MQNPNLLNLIFQDIKKFDIQNPVIGNLLSQVKAIKLSDKDITRKILGDLETTKLEDAWRSLEELKKPINLNEISDDNDDNDDDNNDYRGNLNQRFNQLRYGRVQPTPPLRN